MQTRRTEMSDAQAEALIPKHYKYNADQGADRWKDLVRHKTTTGILN